MKQLKYFTFLCFLLALVALMLPFSSVISNSTQQEIVFYIYTNPLIYISIATILTVALVSFSKRKVINSFFGLMLSLSNLFFIVLLSVVSTFSKSLDFHSDADYKLGAYLMLSVAPLLVLFSAVDLYQSYKNRL